MMLLEPLIFFVLALTKQVPFCDTAIVVERELSCFSSLLNPEVEWTSYES